jgi:hypothetical protein
MNEVTTSKAVVTSPLRRGTKRLSPNHLWELATRLFMFKADRWRRRARFYEQHRDYFPRLSAGRFVDRCRKLEMLYQRLAEVMLAVPIQAQQVPVRAITMRKKRGWRIALPDRLTSI